MYSDNQLRIMFGAGSIALVSALLGGLAYFSRPLPPDGDPVLGTPQLVMFETDGCDWCEKFRRKTARDFQETSAAAQAPLRYMSIQDGPPPKRYRLESFSRSPMLVLFDQYGRELGRIDSEPKNSAAIESLVRRNLRNTGKG